jgi:ABC-2 type transport system ATP-binding protein
LNQAIDMPQDAGPPALLATGLGRKYRRGWALRDCTFRIPAGTVCALVGPNGAGKTTLMSMVADLLSPTTGQVAVSGRTPRQAAAEGRVAFLAQDKPLYPRFTVAEMLRMGRELNPGWDQAGAEQIVAAGDIPLPARVNSLSGGQRTRVALAMAFGKRPDLLLLDEPMSDLDPLVRHEMMRMLSAEAAERGTTVLMSSHMVAEMEGVCDWVLTITGGRVRLAGEADELIAAHACVIAAHAGDGLSHELGAHTVVEALTVGRQLTALIRPEGPLPPHWNVRRPTLEEMILSYLRCPEAPPLLTADACGGPKAVAS